jgi:hypothetical protein
MTTSILPILQRLLAEKSSSIAEQPALLRAALNDLTKNQAKREVALLVSAAELGIPQKFAQRSATSIEPIEAALRRAAQSLHDDRGVDADAAEWAVETWAVALGMITEADAARIDSKPRTTTDVFSASSVTAATQTTDTSGSQASVPYPIPPPVPTPMAQVGVPPVQQPIIPQQQTTNLSPRKFSPTLGVGIAAVLLCIVGVIWWTNSRERHKETVEARKYQNSQDNVVIDDRNTSIVQRGVLKEGLRFEGTVGKIPVFITLKHIKENTIEGNIIYKKYGVPIPLQGNFRSDGNSFQLQEYDPEGRQTANLEGVFENEFKISGTWSKIDGSKKYSLTLSR